ncbi:hypothetical protein DPMN_103429 [Dreissena polymorpha]|uniref:Uncharacterized protein n=1 Tax=Dreissena polymorpha TaxID=45954 RepID=A0A9D4H9R6_DREPO|nr:hypothetical protein DPMN_103429 [Dreissena polymorpha]
MTSFAIKYLKKEMATGCADTIYMSDKGVSDNGYHSSNVSPGSVNRQTPSPIDSGLESDNSPGRATKERSLIDGVSITVIALNK